LHGLLLSIAPVDLIATFWVVLIGAAVLVLSSAICAWFHDSVLICACMSENCIFNWVIL
jgi:hypothetical protein